MRSNRRPRAPKADAQHERFIETARQVGADEDKERFDEKLGPIARAPKGARTYQSPDGLLRFQISQHDADTILTFGFPWHTHADLLAQFCQTSEEDAVDRFLQGLINGEWIIAIYSNGADIMDICVVEDEEAAVRSKPDGQTVETRRWDGTAV